MIMVASLKKLGVKFPGSKHPRAEKSLSNIIEAATLLITKGDPKTLNSRSLSTTSGYSLGALVKRLGKVENAFLHAIAICRTHHLRQASQILESFDDNKSSFEFAKLIVDIAFEKFPKSGIPIIKYYESRAISRTKSVADAHAYTDEIVPLLRRVVRSNKSGTFRNIQDNEFKYLARAIFLFLEQPFIVDDPLAGTEHHRKMATALIASLFCALPCIDSSVNSIKRRA